MAEPVLLSDLKVWWGGYALEGSQNRCSFQLKNKENPDGRFGDVLEPAYPGLIIPSVDLGGFYSAGAGEPDAVIAPRVGLLGTHDKTTWPLSLCPPNAPSAAAGALGNIAYTVGGAVIAYELGEKHGDSLPYKLKNEPRSGDRVYRQYIVLDKSSRAATTTGTGYQLGAVTALQQIVCTLHMFGVTGGTWTLTVESDDNSGFTTPVTRITMTAATAVTRELKVLAGAITDDWWRVVLTKSGGTSCIASALLSVSPL
jgi:hypothetical protein